MMATEKPKCTTTDNVGINPSENIFGQPDNTGKRGTKLYEDLNCGKFLATAGRLVVE